MTQEIAVRTGTEDRAIAIRELETRFALAVRQRELLESYIRERLKPNKHFYIVKSGNQEEDSKKKPSLAKEGAELICLPHALKPKYFILSGPGDPPQDDSPYQLTMKCELWNGTQFGGEGIGSANSMTTKKTGERIQRQRDPGLRHNATLKMAQKSAYIAACLNATAASEFFTQDMEDIQETEQPDTADKTKHWCTEHKTAFFMKGKMKSYAHPIGDTGEWCHEHTENKETPTPEQEKATNAKPEASQQGTGKLPEFKNMAEVFSYANKQGITMAKIKEIIGTNNPKEVTSDIPTVIAFLELDK